MECYHGLVSLDHELSGELDLGAPVEFTGGRGYIEKDWGTSFPSAYVWMQSNHFDAPGVSLMASVARIPWRGASFTGFLATLLLDGEILPFATWSGARLEVVEIAGSEVHLVVVDRRHRLEIRAARPGDPGRPGDGFGSLHSPVEGAMQARIAETLTAEIQVRLTRSGQPDAALFHGVGQSAGLEIEANTSDLVPEKGDR